MGKKNTKSKDITMVVDGSNLAYRAYFKFRNIHTKSHGHLGLVYGFLKILYSYIVRFNPTKMVVIFDTKQSKKSNFRNALLEDYKVLRTIKSNLDFDIDSFNKQIRILCKILGHLGITLIFDKEGLGHETDDYIAYIVTKDTKDKYIIVSSDKDFYQLVNNNIKIYNPSKEEIIAPYNGVKAYGFTPEDYLQVHILTGDKSDGVPGYKGIGPVKAKQFIEQFGSIQGYLDSKEEFPRVTKEGVEFLYNRNRVLIDLKYALEKYPITKVPLINKTFNYKRAFRNLDKYSMSTFLSKEFTQTFKNLKQWTDE